MRNGDDITIIIRNKNEERWIGFAIQSALDFFVRPEIIVIDDKVKQVKNGVLADIASTAFSIMGITKPEIMKGKSLIE